MNAPYPMLWFDDQAAEAAEFYTSVFPASAILHTERYGEGVPGREAGSVMTIEFTINGTKLSALNGGPHHVFNESFSMVVECGDQAEIDRLWEALTADGGRESQCGWLVDRYGLSWQIVPENISELLAPPGAVQAMLQMKKLDIAALRAAAGT